MDSVVVGPVKDKDGSEEFSLSFLRFDMKKLFRFYWDCGRMGELHGLFVEDDAVVRQYIGHDVYFGEVLGKHSEICGKLEEKDCVALTDDQDFIQKAIDFGLVPTGFNPITTIEERE